jgi:hypothetical protein
LGWLVDPLFRKKHLSVQFFDCMLLGAIFKPLEINNDYWYIPLMRKPVSGSA